jgi:hypothetical protein
LIEVIEQRRVGLVHLRHQNRLQPLGVLLVRVPERVAGVLVALLPRPVDLHERDTRFDQPPGEKDALPELVRPIAVANGGRLRLQVEGPPGGR